MTYVLIGLAVLGIVSGIGLAVWVGRLKDALIEADRKYSELAGRWNIERQAGATARAEVISLRDMLDALRIEHERVVRKIETGSLSDAAGIAAELRLLRPLG